MTHEDVLNKLRERFGADGFTTSEFRDNRRVLVGVDELYEVLQFLKETCGFDMLVELSAADYLRLSEREGSLRCLVHPAEHGDGAAHWVKTFVNDPDPLDAVGLSAAGASGRTGWDLPRSSICTASSSRAIPICAGS